MPFLGCIHGEVRLVEGINSLEGRVEICRNDMWGTVCHSRWDSTDAATVCRQLGLSSIGTKVGMKLLMHSM